MKDYTTHFNDGRQWSWFVCYEDDGAGLFVCCIEKLCHCGSSKEWYLPSHRHVTHNQNKEGCFCMWSLKYSGTLSYPCVYSGKTDIYSCVATSMSHKYCRQAHPSFWVGQLRTQGRSASPVLSASRSSRVSATTIDENLKKRRGYQGFPFLLHVYSLSKDIYSAGIE